MADITEKQEQEMIERAKSGDPEANYQLSLWALAQGEAEPEEERWNRLAAKCLVRAAEAGYEPAKVKMEELLAQTAAEAPAAPRPVSEPAPAAARPAQEAAPAAAPEPAAAPAAEKSAPAPAKAGAAVTAALAGVGAKLKSLFSRGAGKEAGGESNTGGKKPAFLDFSQWDSAKWKKMQIVCIVICVVLVLLIILMVATRKKGNKDLPEEVVPTPVAEVVSTPEPAVTTPEPARYPDEATREEIAGAGLDVFPEEGDFVTEAKTVTVSTSGSVLNLRRGPGSSYGQVSSMPNGTAIGVYAYKNGWALVKYGDIWGWCSNDYLK